MGENTKIAWTSTRLPDGTLIPGHTFNPWIGCFKVSPGCDHCYAETQAKRYKWDVWGPPVHPRTGEIYTHRRKTSESYWKQPFKWEKQAVAEGTRHRVFCASMADVFEDHPEVEPWRAELWPIIRQTPHLDWQLLTKRPENIPNMVPWVAAAWPNVWLGASVENQKYAEERIPALLRTPAVVHFLSCEPLLGPIVFLPHLLTRIDWIITGGESGPGYRPMDPEWARDIRDQCEEWGVAYFHKQNGGMRHDSGGHLLDGEEYYNFPIISHRIGHTGTLT